MPTRARGFWFCDFCSASFDTPEEAEDHERSNECQHHPHVLLPPPPPPQHQLQLQHAFDPYRQPQPLPQPHPSIAAAYLPPIPPHLSQPQPHIMPPYSPDKHQHLHAASPHGRGEGESPSPSPFGFETAPPPPPAAIASKLHQQRQPQQQQQPTLRRYRLMDDNLSSSGGSLTSRLAPADMVACQHLEFTEATTTSTERFVQVGLRCQRCGDGTQNELSLPRAIRFLADAIRRLADQHLCLCPQLSVEERRILQDAQARRANYQQLQLQLHSHPRSVSTGSSGEQEFWDKDERDRQVLIDFCSMRCQQLGIVNKHPENSGIVFREAAVGAAASSTQAQQQQQQQQQARGYEPPMRRQPTAGRTFEEGGGQGYHQPHPMHPQHGGYYHQQQPSPYEPTSTFPSFPFYQDVDGDWLCKFCCHLHPQYRDPNYRWSSATSTPPPGEYIDHHLSVCRSFLHQQQQHASMPPFHAQHHATSHHPPSPLDFGPSTPIAYHHQGGTAYPSPHAYSPQQQQHPHPPPPWEHPASSSSRGGTSARSSGSTSQQQRRASSSSASPPPPPPPYQHSQPSPSAVPARSGFAAAAAASSQSSAEMTTMLMASASTMSPSTHLSRSHPPPPSHHLSRAAEGGARVQRDRNAEMSAKKAVEFLAAEMSISQQEGPGRAATAVPDFEQLVRDEDKLLLTDFLYYLMKQLQIVRFSEADRKTRGGKREKIQLGFGGLQCTHCMHTAKSRKFFWSGVDRLANSFAEIPAHIFKCSSCPSEIKDALTNLKKVHAEQMARLPRGSQKVFFRRVWKRLHEGDPVRTSEGDEAEGAAAGTPSGGGRGGNLKPPPHQPGSGGGGTTPGDKDSSPDSKQLSPEGTSGSEESMFALERPTKDSAKALADAAMQVSGPPSPSSRVLLAIAEDRDFLSDTDCYIRRQLEVFCATKDDVKVAQEDRKFPVKEGQVGIRCVHCAMIKHGAGASGHAVSYPFSINSIFEAVREFQRLHLDYCENLPAAVRSKISSSEKESTTITSIQRKYYALAAKGLGLRDTKDGIRAGNESVPVVSQAVFAFSGMGTPTAGEAARRERGSPHSAGSPPEATSSPFRGTEEEEEDDEYDADQQHRLHLMMDQDPGTPLFEFSEPLSAPALPHSTTSASRKRQRGGGDDDDDEEEEDEEEAESSKKPAPSMDPGGNGGDAGSPF